jgi:hypothetical protein
VRLLANDRLPLPFNSHLPFRWINVYRKRSCTEHLFSDLSSIALKPIAAEHIIGNLEQPG